MSESKPVWIVVVAHNNLDLLQQAVASFEAQRGEGMRQPRVLVINNASHDGTTSWLHARPNVFSIHNYPQRGVAHAWNQALRYLFSLGGQQRVDRVLVCNQDVVLRLDTWYWLEREQAEFVTAVGSAEPGSILPISEYRGQVETGLGPMHMHVSTREYAQPRPDAKRPHPDFSCFMISRSCYQHVGPFDENYLGAFVEDSDYHCRLHQAGIQAYSIDLPFWHVGGGSQTIKRASETEQQRIANQAARNRLYFETKWGFPIPTPENEGRLYYRFFGHEAPQGAQQRE